MSDHHYPTNTFEERLAKAVEETGELMVELGSVLKALGKGGRHGWTPIDKRTGIPYNNARDAINAWERAFDEFNDLHRIMFVLCNDLTDKANDG